MDFSATPERLLLAVILSLSAGWALGQYWRARELRRNKHRVRREARIIIHDAQRERTHLLLDAELESKRRFLDESSRLNKAVEQRERELATREESIKGEIAELKRLLAQTTEANTQLVASQQEISSKGEELEKRRIELDKEFARLAGQNVDEAREHLLGRRSFASA